MGAAIFPLVSCSIIPADCNRSFRGHQQRFDIIATSTNREFVPSNGPVSGANPPCNENCYLQKPVNSGYLFTLLNQCCFANFLVAAYLALRLCSTAVFTDFSIPVKSGNSLEVSLRALWRLTGNVT
jgi:hypothetical protein